MEEYYTTLIGQKVLIRASQSGVHFGTLTSIEPASRGFTVVLKNSKRVHYWSGACSLSQLVVDGVYDVDKVTRISVPVDIMLVVAIEVIPMTEAQYIVLDSIPVWKTDHLDD